MKQTTQAVESTEIYTKIYRFTVLTVQTFGNNPNKPMIKSQGTKRKSVPDIRLMS